MFPWQDAGWLDRLTVGLSIVTFHPDEPERIAWVYVNEARCRLVGKTREELLSQPPMDVQARETLAQLKVIFGRLRSEGRISVQSMLLHKTHRPVPVVMHLSLIEGEEGELVLTEMQDITDFKRTESQLTRAQDRARHIMALVSDEKRQIAENIRDNVSLVSLPVIDQLRATALPEQRDLLDVLERRIRHVTGRLGVRLDGGPAGASLTRREMLVCEMVRDGLTSKAIAAALGCSPSTVNNHRNAIRRKLGLRGGGTNLQAFLDRTSREADRPGTLDATELDGLI